MPINLRKILAWLESLDYIILRPRKLSEYGIGSDIDILTNNKPAVINLLICGLKDDIADGYDVVKIDESEHTHLDVIRGDKLIVRFDVVDRLPTVNATEFLLKNRIKKDSIFYPDKVGDVYTRVVEYLNNPQKTKHLEHAKSHCI